MYAIRSYYVFLDKIGRPELLEPLIKFPEWHKIVAKTLEERKYHSRPTMREFRLDKWRNNFV